MKDKIVVDVERIIMQLGIDRSKLDGIIGQEPPLPVSQTPVTVLNQGGNPKG